MSAAQYNHWHRGNYRIFASHAWYVPDVPGMFILLGLLLAGALLGSLVTSLFVLIAGRGAGGEYAMLIAYPVQFLPALIYAGVKGRNNSPYESGYALDSKNFAPLSGLVCALLAIAGTAAASFAGDAAGLALPPMPAWLDNLMKNMTGGNFLVDFISVSIMAPVLEEWLCRGMVLRGLLYKSKVKPVWAIVISAAFFALIHMNPWQAVPAFLLGCLFGYVYYKTGSLKLVMLMHFTNNTLALAAGHVEAWKYSDHWINIMGPKLYWTYFVLALVIVGLVLLAFEKIKPLSPEGSCRKMEPLFGEIS